MPSAKAPAHPAIRNNTNFGNEFVLFFAVEGFRIALYLKCKVRAKDFNARIRATACRRQDHVVMGGVLHSRSELLPYHLREGRCHEGGIVNSGDAGILPEADAVCSARRRSPSGVKGSVAEERKAPAGRAGAMSGMGWG